MMGNHLVMFSSSDGTIFKMISQVSVSIFSFASYYGQSDCAMDGIICFEPPTWSVGQIAVLLLLKGYFPG